MEYKEINKILLRRKQQILSTQIVLAEMPSDIKEKIYKLNNELKSLGYRLSCKLIYNLMHQHINIEELESFLIENIKSMIGQVDNMTPLIHNFLEDDIERELYEAIYIEYKDNKEMLSNAIKSLNINIELIKEPNPVINNKYKVIDIAVYKDVLDLARNIISSKTAYSQQDKEDLEVLFEHEFSNILYMLPESIDFKENLVYITKLLLNKNIEPEEFSHLYKTYTDVLRLAVALSDGDISLAIKTHFKNFTRKERKMLLELFNNCKINPEDMLRHKEMYLRLGEKIHPGEYKKKYPKTFKSFNNLRNHEKKIKKNTFNHKKEEFFLNKNIEELIKLLKTRPGEFARSLNRLLVLSEELNYNSYYIVNEFKKVANVIPISTLLILQKYFTNRCSTNDRVFYPKGQISKAYGIGNNLKELDVNLCIYTSITIEEIIKEILAEKNYLGKVYIDKNLHNYAIPLKMRNSSKSLKIVERGSRFKIENNTIRLFLHWMNEIYKNNKECKTDLDLSVVMYDKNFNRVDSVSFHNLYTNGCIHSGDYVNAPVSEGGATEYINIELENIHKKCKYIIVVIDSYSNQPFYNLPECYVGYMDIKNKEDKTPFNPSCVKFKSDLNSDSVSYTPFIIDVTKKELIWSDLNFSCKYICPNINNHKNQMIYTLENILNTEKPDMYSLALYNAEARGKIVDNIAAADVIFTDKKDELLENHDITRYREIEKIIEEPILDEDGKETGEYQQVITKEIETYEAKIITPFDTDIISSKLL